MVRGPRLSVKATRTTSIRYCGHTSSLHQLNVPTIMLLGVTIDYNAILGWHDQQMVNCAAVKRIRLHQKSGIGVSV